MVPTSALPRSPGHPGNHGGVLAWEAGSDRTWPGNSER